jgi:hypothetical protein
VAISNGHEEVFRYICARTGIHGVSMPVRPVIFK